MSDSTHSESGPVCDCYPGGFTPDAFEGPKETCPVHGRRAYLSDEDMSDLDSHFSPGLSNGMARFDMVESLIRREIAKELDRLAQDDAEDMLSESDYGPDATVYRAVTVETILERSQAVRNG